MDLEERRRALRVRYVLMEHEVAIAGRRLCITGTEGIDALLDELAARSPDDPDRMDERLPYWAEIWPSSVALAEYILAHAAVGPADHVVELGCGLGLTGVAAGTLGASVVFTDYMTDALQFAALNWIRNVGTEPSSARLDWRRPDPSLTADCLLAADVAYERRFFAPLLDTCDALLSPGGRLLLSEPRRPVAHDFLIALRRRGYAWEQEVRMAAGPAGPVPVDVYDVRRVGEDVTSDQGPVAGDRWPVTSDQ